MHSLCAANPPLRSPASPPRWRRSRLCRPRFRSNALRSAASPGPGAAQHLVDSLEPGQIGCLHGGAYAGNVKVTTAGITLTRFGAEHATSRAASGSRGAPTASRSQGSTSTAPTATRCPRPTVNADNATFRRNDVTNDHHSICFALGHPTGVAPTTR